MKSLHVGTLPYLTFHTSYTYLSAKTDYYLNLPTLPTLPTYLIPTGGTLPYLPTIQNFYLRFYTLPRRYLPYPAKKVDTYLQPEPIYTYLPRYLIESNI